MVTYKTKEEIIKDIEEHLTPWDQKELSGELVSKYLNINEYIDETSVDVDIDNIIDNHKTVFLGLRADFFSQLLLPFRQVQEFGCRADEHSADADSGKYRIRVCLQKSEQRSVHMGIEHGGHHNVAGLEREAVHIASGTEADVQGLGGVAVGKAVGHVCGGEQQDILAAQGGLDIGFQLSLRSVKASLFS